jgi:hypothetical protein
MVEVVKISQIEFPYDWARDTSCHGRVASFLMRCHPLALWIPAALVGAIVGLLR